MLYQFHEFQRAMLSPLTAWAQAASKSFANPSSPLSLVPGATRLAAGYELLYRLGKDYEKPEFGIHQIVKDGHNIPIVEQTIIEKPFCRLLRFKRYADDSGAVGQLKDEPIVLVCAPLSGHHATLLRDTVRTLLQDHKVYITDWIDARMVPAEVGSFHLDDYVGYIQEFIRHIGARNLHVISVCQPTVPVLAAISLMASRGEDTPLTMTMMGGPIDARKSPTSVNSLATNRSHSWFENNVIHTVPANYPGEGRKVYPGFLQHTGFVAMNPERHAQSHWDFYQSLLRGDEEDAEAHRRFYDEYNAVLDMAAEYYLDTIRIVFQEFRLAEGTWDIHGGAREAGRYPFDRADDDRGRTRRHLGQRPDARRARAVHGHRTGAPPQPHRREVRPLRHFSGRRWRTIIYPQLRDFIREHASQPKKPTPQAGPTPNSPSTPSRSASGSETASAAPAKAAALKLSAKRTAAKTRAAKPPAAKRGAIKLAAPRTRKAA